MADSLERGVLTKWDDERGFGFLKPAAGGRDVFVHATAIRPGRRPKDGDQFEYEVTTDAKGRRKAAWARPVNRSRSGSDSWRARRLAILPALALLVALIPLILAGLPVIIPLGYLVMSLLTWWLYYRDKRAAIAGTWRISEQTLQLAALLGGWPGALVAQQVLRHKNRKRSFQLVFWAMVALNLAALLAIVLHPNWLAWNLGW